MMQVKLAALLFLAYIMGINAGTNFDATWTSNCPSGMLTSILLFYIYNRSDLIKLHCRLVEFVVFIP